MVHQRDEQDRKKFLTFMILPHNSMRKILRINLPHWLVTILGALLIVTFVGIAGSFIYSTKIATRLLHYYSLKTENKRQESQIRLFIEKTKELEDGIRELEERDQELREMLGLQKSVKKKSELISQVITGSEDLANRLAFLQNYLQTKKQDYLVLRSTIKEITYKYDNIPSIWPVHGDIFSGFGWRRHPFRGGQEFHKGIDIPVWVGCPVRVAADGVVTYADWSNGYGKTVIVDHGNDYSTLYAHCERLLVKSGDKVYKGQLVAKAGSTGLSTGPHVHYEVQFKNKVVSPVQFLDLNIAAAMKLP